MKIDKKKLVLIFGGSKGLGNSCANLFKEKTNIILISRNKKNLMNIKKRFNSKNIETYVCDVLKEKNLKKFFINLKKRYNKVDAIICNVGSGSFKNKYILNQNEWNDVIFQNFIPTTNVIENYFNFFHNKKNICKIIVISSIAGHFSGNAPFSYSLAKNMLMQYVKHISIFMSKNNILINSISPGHIMSKGNNWYKKLMSEPKKVKKIKNTKISLKRFCTPDDIANYINYLIYYDKDYISGTDLKIDGITIN